ncbi:uncharacterized protein J4E78_002730 [Alternaria triticimaculans]|uniref:uncharacterized protein n=1 Tax=Alternaria triticimaculans TaxID=297637 RepID=UPI0020C427AA|nr:uncharacterized protein J4E78_002730 [Alternaria triticimaculans]KAI4665270.1 hypothetical protein J4E78_002730 [Alternaria triticimaculans]
MLQSIEGYPEDHRVDPFDPDDFGEDTPSQEPEHTITTVSTHGYTKAFYTLAGIIHEERSECFTFFGNTDDIRIIPRSPTKHAVEFFELVTPTDENGHASLYISTRWKLLYGNKELYIHRYADNRSSWTPARQWLKQSYGKTVRNTGLWSDYVRLGQKFPFMRLPKELRYMVFEALVGPVLRPRIRESPFSWRPIRLLRTPEGELIREGTSTPDESQNPIDPRLVWPSRLDVEGPEWDRVYTRASCCSFQCPCALQHQQHSNVVPLLLVSKTFSIEFQQIAWVTTTKHFDRVYDIVETIPKMQTLPFMALRRISLKLTNLDYFRLLNYRDGPAEDTGPLALEMLMGLENLRFLEIEFTTGPPRLGHIRVLNKGWADPFSVYETSCQAVLVDWFFMGLYMKFVQAKTDTRLVPHITFTGHVKHSTRAKWEPIWQSLKWGVRHDFSRKIEMIISTPVGQL